MEQIVSMIETSKTPLGGDRQPKVAHLLERGQGFTPVRQDGVTPLSHRVNPPSHRSVFRMAYLAMFSGETDVEIELSVLRTPRKHH